MQNAFSLTGGMTVVEQIVEQEKTVWQKICQTDKPVLLYGMGDGAEKIVRVLDTLGKKIDGVFASDEYVRGHSFLGFPVLRYDEALRQFGDFMALVAFAVHDEPTMEKIYRMADEQELYLPDVPVIGGGLFDDTYAKIHAGELEKAYGLLADAQSWAVFENTLRFKLSGKAEYLREMTTPKEEAYRQVLAVRPGMRYLDLGAYDGDTLREFVCHAGMPVRAEAWEPDSKNYKKLARFTLGADYPLTPRPLGSWSEPDTLRFCRKAGRNSALGEDGNVEIAVSSVDAVYPTEDFDLIKMDVEGAERRTLLGCRAMIARCHPSLIISCYHRSEDLFDLPLLVHRLYPGYRLYLRHHPYLPAWETNLYAVAEEEGRGERG